MQRLVTWAAAALLSATVACGAWAHGSPQGAVRELVRLQGHRTETSPPGTSRRVEVTALGKAYTFAVGDWQVFALAGKDRRESDAASNTVQRIVLQGSREELARFVAARPEQRVTLLAERRPGSSEWFVLALDLCPSE